MSDDLPFTCEFCFESFEDEFAIAEHFRENHPYEDAFPELDEEPDSGNFEDNSNFEKESEEKTSKNDAKKRVRKRRIDYSRNIVCKKCGDNFYCLKDINDHIVDKHSNLVLSDDGSEIYQCNTCMKTFKDVSDLKKDIRENHSKFKPGKRPRKTKGINHSKIKGPFLCPELECEEILPNYETFLAHMEKHKEDKQPSCQLCPKKFASNEWLSFHMENTHGIKKPSNSINSNSTSKVKGSNLGKTSKPKSSQNSAKYKPINPHESYLKCGMCAIRVNFLTELNEHILEVHTSTIITDEGEILECKSCKKQVPNLRRFKQHISARHRPEDEKIKRVKRDPIAPDENGPWTCEICKVKRVSHKSYLAHVKTHENNDEHFCPLCTKKFSSEEWLSLHFEKVHNKSENLDKKSSDEDEDNEDYVPIQVKVEITENEEADYDEYDPM